MRLASSFCLIMFGQSSAWAHDCVKPAAPILPDQAALSLGERNAATLRLDAYIAEMNSYLACLERSDAEARAEAERLIRRWEATGEELTVIE